MNIEEKKQQAIAAHYMSADAFLEDDFERGWDACYEAMQAEIKSLKMVAGGSAEAIRSIAEEKEELALLVRRWNNLAVMNTDLEVENKRLRWAIDESEKFSARRQSDLEALKAENERLRDALQGAQRWMKIKISGEGEDPVDCNVYREIEKALEK